MSADRTFWAPIEEEYPRVKAQNEAERKQLLAEQQRWQSTSGNEPRHGGSIFQGRRHEKSRSEDSLHGAPDRVKNRWLSLCTFLIQ
jgi:hypothetical protein